MIEDGVLREAAVNWFPLTNAQVRELALECLALRAVAAAAEATGTWCSAPINGELYVKRCRACEMCKLYDALNKLAAHDAEMEKT